MRIDAALAHGYVINQAAARKLYHFLTPVKFAADEWKLFREYEIVKLKRVISPVIELTDMYLNSSIGNDRTYKLTKLDQKNRKRPLFSEIKLFLWRIFIRTWLKKIRP
ncbi:hypothetical protein XNC1_1194 [Xenorhabdus nematophila ATCC 19061]|uniref:Uncharacterized protein n=1 Tax=Xenorhabdus nematophila (strain ATCC 19061 / DSM 3370 / CCUG 14189 / LMG 1036 / NCIMB 9965 / AN6) TaxID=406817 RepID=D3V9M7_XENNA|nr:hypothetical protein [Xenorhabdus nematophila]CBJ89265.1 hypothetical protein XNC1_1194 [Xenorhabdus nematophila ATCC 19061]CEK22168.1 hypothetical protein XNC2_1172 [Xenorhabdus nematophila AN6/1]